MESLKVDYSDLFVGLDGTPDSYREIADKYEWAKRDVEQHVLTYAGFPSFTDYSRTNYIYGNDLMQWL